MSKYQEALDTISYMTNVNLLTIREISLTKPLVGLLQELVDRDTPMKPDYPKEYPSACCPKCSQNLGDNNFCRNCGQRIDWNENNE